MFLHPCQGSKIRFCYYFEPFQSFSAKLIQNGCIVMVRVRHHSFVMQKFASDSFPVFVWRRTRDSLWVWPFLSSNNGLASILSSWGTYNVDDYCCVHCYRTSETINLRGKSPYWLLQLGAGETCKTNHSIMEEREIHKTTKLTVSGINDRAF